MASPTVTPKSFHAQPLTITSQQIAKYAEHSALVSQLEIQQRALRAELLELYKAGAEQEADSPYLLAFINQERHAVDWKARALELAVKVYGMEMATAWKLEVEASAPALQITQVRVKPNPAYAAGLTKPAASVRISLTPHADGSAVTFGG